MSSAVLAGLEKEDRLRGGGVQTGLLLAMSPVNNSGPSLAVIGGVVFTVIPLSSTSDSIPATPEDSTMWYHGSEAESTPPTTSSSAAKNATPSSGLATPIPWKVSATGGDVLTPGTSDILIGAEHHWIARLFHPESHMKGTTSLAPAADEAKANADLIVRAVNSHDNLLAALAGLQLHHKRIPYGLGACATSCPACQRDAAIAKTTQP